MKITEDQFEAAAKALLPHYIMVGYPPSARPYRLDAHMLMGGSFRISYWNYYLDAEVRKVFDENWKDPFDCIKVVLHRVSQTIGCSEITEQEFEAATLPFNENAGLVETKESGSEQFFPAAFPRL